MLIFLKLFLVSEHKEHTYIHSSHMSENIDTNNIAFCGDENNVACVFKTLCGIVMVVLH